MADFIASGWHEILRHNGIHDFENVWRLAGEWYEPPDSWRSGWSGVVRCTLKLPTDGSVEVFVKLQKNSLWRTVRHPWTGIPTVEKEWRNIRHCQERGLSTIEPVYFAKRRGGGNVRAVMMTKGLTDFVSIEDLLRRWRRFGWPPPATRASIVRQVASNVAAMHRHRLCHSSLYPKHLFIGGPLASDSSGSVGEDKVGVCLIDLESMRRCWFRWQAVLRDLDCLNRHFRGVSQTDRLRFLMAYLEIDRLTTLAKRLHRRLDRMAQPKARWRRLYQTDFSWLGRAIRKRLKRCSKC